MGKEHEQAVNAIVKVLKAVVVGSEGFPRYEEWYRSYAEEILKAIIEWGNETCPHYDKNEGTMCFKHACDKCWEELTKCV